MSGDVITLGNMVNAKQKAIIRHISDFFDNHRGNVSGNIALTKFGNSASHTILFNTLSPELDGKQLISVENNDSVLFAPLEIKSVICSDKRNNEGINTLIEKTNKKHIWEARSDDKIIKLLLRLDEQEDLESEIAGFSITFADAVRTKYRIGVTMVNSENEIISQTTGLDSSFESNNAQFFQFANTVQGATRIVVDIEVVGTNIYEWKLNNITLYSHMNGKSLQSLADLGVITYSMYPNSVMVREAKDDILKVENEGKPTNEILKKGQEAVASPAIEETFEHTDSFGTPLVQAPNLNHQFFDNLQSAQMTKIANIKRLYSTTETRNGKKIYTFETDPNTKNLTLTFSPSDELNRYPDEPVYDMEKLVEKGHIKKGGFKNYCLTFFLKMDDITMQDQYLVLKTGGWLFNDQLPDLARAVDFYIPITGSDPRPQVFTEYKYNFFNEVKDGIKINEVQAPIIQDGKWIGFQFTKQVIDKDNAINTLRINTNPVDENGNFTNKEFKDFLIFEDKSTEDHQAGTWGSVNEIISVSGSKYVSVYGISIYEVQW
jgi:hypothetical protein